ncbi:MAG: PHA/PHB synthase family protein, partial [Pseudomonas sp.]
TGLCNLAKDSMLGRPLPAQTEVDALHVGRDVAATPGHVVLRKPLFELIQYQPTTHQVSSLPLVIIPPPLNRFYLLDMTPDTSLVSHAVEQGLEVFLVSWRNPNPSHCNWGLEAYALAVDEAVRAACEISGAPQATLLGVCAGGLVSLMLQGYYAASGVGLLAATSYLVTPIDPRMTTDATLFAGPRARRALRNSIWRQGCLNVSQLAAGFSWLRPEQLIWPHAMQRYLLGQTQDAHPIRFWNQDCTRLPAQLVDDLIALLEHDPLRYMGGQKVNGVPVDLQRVDTPSWHLGALRDHIVPWTNCYPSNRLGGDKTFVLCNSGHIQGVVNPPGHPRAWYQRAGVTDADATRWLETGTRLQGSWWPDWSAWIKSHSGPLRPAPATPGSTKYSPLQAAPGRYVHQL